MFTNRIKAATNLIDRRPSQSHIQGKCALLSFRAVWMNHLVLIGVAGTNRWITYTYFIRIYAKGWTYVALKILIESKRVAYGFLLFYDIQMKFSAFKSKRNLNIWAWWNRMRQLRFSEAEVHLIFSEIFPSSFFDKYLDKFTFEWINLIKHARPKVLLMLIKFSRN